MPTPEYVLKLRESVGHAPLPLPGVMAVVLQDVPPGAPLTEVPKVLLVKRADTGAWAPVEGIAEPGEEPHLAAIREVKEETGLDVQVEALLGVGALDPVEYPNGDVVNFTVTAMRCKVTGDPEAAAVNDDENTDIGWFSVMQMPPMAPHQRLLIGDAVAQLRRPEGFTPRMGFHKRDRLR